MSIAYQIPAPGSPSVPVSSRTNEDGDEVLTRDVAPGTVATCTNVISALTSTPVLSANPLRLGLYIVNDSTATLYLKFGTAASLSSWTHKLLPGGFYEMPARYYTGVVTGIWTAASGYARVTEIDLS